MLIVLAAAFLAVVAPSVALAHSAPIPIAIWGGFTGDQFECQRTVARSAATCALTAWAASDACWRARITGNTCDDAGTSATIEAAHTSALAAAEAACRAVDIVSLGYNTMIDLDIDIDIFCQQLQDAMTSAVFGPASRSGVMGEPARACMMATSDAADRLLRGAFRARRYAFDRIASVSLTPSRKFTLLRASASRIAREQQIVQARLATRCPTFGSVYPQSLASLLSLIAQRADCLSGRTYVQDFVQCPNAVCGNGMREPSEGCDDGNTESGDGCGADCQSETP